VYLHVYFMYDILLVSLPLGVDLKAHNKRMTHQLWKMELLPQSHELHFYSVIIKERFLEFHNGFPSPTQGCQNKQRTTLLPPSKTFNEDKLNKLKQSQKKKRLLYFLSNQWTSSIILKSLKICIPLNAQRDHLSLRSIIYFTFNTQH